MDIKTYGVYGLAEWHGKIKAGSLELNVSFTGGTSSPGGTKPAYLMTKDPITQFIIENSKEYKTGFFQLVMSQTIKGEHPRMAVPLPKVEVPKKEEPKEKVNEFKEEQSVKKVEVVDKSDAVEYLKEHFASKNYSATSLRTKGAFDAACQECGIEFIFKS